MGKEGRMLYVRNNSGFEAGCYVDEMPVTFRFTIHPQKTLNERVKKLQTKRSDIQCIYEYLSQQNSS